VQESLDSLAVLLATEKIVTICLACDDLEFLARYMRGRKVISDVFGRLPIRLGVGANEPAEQVYRLLI
jgi:hypothetical protein